MSFKLLISKVFTFAKDLFGPQVVDNNLNASLLAFANTAYRIQSRFLRIPDHLGIFSPGPSRRQVWEASTFIVKSTEFWSSRAAILLFASAIFGLCNRRPNWGKFFWECSVYVLIDASAMYEDMRFDSHRAQGYVWDDWRGYPV